MSNRVLIIHHCDNDGHMSAAIMKQFALGIDSESIIDFASADYRDAIKDIVYQKYGYNKYDIVIVVDMSITREDNYKWLIDMNDETNLIYIDHHISTIQFMNEGHEDMKYILGLRISGVSASVLCMLYCTQYHIGQDPAFKYIYDTLENLSNTTDPISRNFIENIWGLYPSIFTDGLKFVDAYDIWDKDTCLGWDDVLTFAVNDIYIDTCTELLPDLNRSNSEKYIQQGAKYNAYMHKEENLGLYKYDEEDPKSDKTCGLLFKNLMNRGRIVREYMNEHNEKLCKQFGFEAVLKTYDDGKPYTVFCLNVPLASSNTFGELIDKYDILCAFYFNGKNWTHSFYSNKEYVDCSELCRKFGGGGHKGAAGFQNNYPIFVEFDIYKV